MRNRAKLLERAENAKQESKYLDFKSEFNPNSSGAWWELIKDVVAFANSGGGIIVFGVSNDGSASQSDCGPILALDVADVSNKIARYTDYEFSDIEIVEVRRGDMRLAALLISGAQVPIVFTKPGTYDVGEGKQKTALSKGTIYFRHGAKSEPGNREDLTNWRDKEVERLRRAWLGGIRKVVETPPGHAITVISSPMSSDAVSPQKGIAITAQVRADPGALRVVPQNAEEVWPYRQKDLLQEVNKRINPARINGHDVMCINAELDTLKSHPEFAYKPHRLASPRYSEEFINWIVEQFRTRQHFFSRMREAYKRRR